MKLARFQQSTGTSLSSARTTANLQSAPRGRSVRRERFIPERTASDALREGQQKIEAITAIGGAIVGVADHFAKKVEEAEFRSQASKAVNSYQESIAKFRAEQINSPITRETEDGGREIVSDSFQQDYSEQAQDIAQQIFDDGLTNERAKAYFEQQRGKIDGKHIGDILKFNQDTRIQVAKADSLEALDKAVTKGGIVKIVDDMANTGLIKYSEAPALTDKYTKDLNFRKSMLGVMQIDNLSGNTEISNDNFFAEVETQYNNAFASLVSGELSKEQFSSISSNIKTVELNREKLVDQQQDLNHLGVMQNLLAAKAAGRDTTALIANAMSGDLTQRVGHDNALATLQAAESIIQSGTENMSASIDASSAVYAYEQGDSDFKSAQAVVNSYAGAIGPKYFQLSQRLLAARKNNVSEKNRQGSQMIDTMVSSLITSVDKKTGNLSREAEQAKSVLRTRLALAIENDPKTNPREWVVNTQLEQIKIPDYLGNTNLFNADVGKGRKHVADTVKSLEDDWDQFSSGIFKTTDGRVVTGIQAWQQAENQLLDEISGMRLLLQDSSIKSLVKDPAKYGINNE